MTSPRAVRLAEGADGLGCLAALARPGLPLADPPASGQVASEMRVTGLEGAAGRLAAAWSVLDGVPDPEVPALSVRDLGIVREVTVGELGTEVVLTPTYSGCPATEVIADSVRVALEQAGFCPVQVTLRRAPAWTTEWISAEGRRKLHAYGIAPPGPVAPEAGDAAVVPIRIRPRGVDCPRCDSSQTERLSAFGSTACKALYRCLACREPFEYFKPI